MSVSQADRQQSSEQPLTGKLTGLKNRLLRPSASSSSASPLPPQQPLMSNAPGPQDSAYEFGALSDMRRPEAQPAQPEGEHLNVHSGRLL